MHRLATALFVLLWAPTAMAAQEVNASSRRLQTDERGPAPESLDAPLMELVPAPRAIPSPAPHALILSDLEQIALKNNPALGRAFAQLEAARGNWVQVGLYPNPQIGYMADEIGAEGSAGMQGGYVSQQFLAPGKLGRSRAQAAWEVQIAEQGLMAQRFRVLTDVRIAFFGVLVAERRIEATERLLRAGNAAVKSSESLLEAGESSEIEVLQFRVQADQANIQRDNAQNIYLEAWQRLAAVVGIPSFAPTPLAGNLEQPPLDIAWESALGRLLTMSPERGRAIADVERARWAYQRARVTPIPDPMVQVGVAGDTATGDTLTNIQIGVPIPVFDRNQGAIRQATAEIAAAEQQVARVEMGLQQRLATVYRRYANARQQVERYTGRILPNAERSFQLTQAAYDSGQVEYLILLGAEQTYFQAVLAYVNALEDLWTATMEIEGLLLQGSLREEPMSVDR